MSSLLWVLLLWQVIVSYGFLQNNPGMPLSSHDTEDPGEPLFLTPYIERGDIGEARRLARATLNDSLEVESYTGFFTVNKAYNSNQFFWYFPSMSPDKKKAPVVIWLQGGPGMTSLVGLFNENGPITVNNDQFERREYHWALNHHVIYIDNPVGVGFSFTKNHTHGYCTNETQVGEQLYSTLTQFFLLFPELQKNDLFITGEGYAGKFVPALAHTILKKDSTAKAKVNLKGLIIGGAWINPATQKNFMPSPVCDPYCYEEDQISPFEWLLNKDATRKRIHVGDLAYTWSCCGVYYKLYYDYCESMAPWLSELLDHYPITFYAGANDHETAPYAGIVDFLRNHFNFTGADEYKNAKQYTWRVDGEVAGCVRRARLVTDIYVLNASYLVPAEQPKRTWDMITRITHGKGFDQTEICPYPTEN